MIHLTCTEDGSDKFWEASVEGSALTVRFGKRGTAGQTKAKTFASPAAAEKELAKLIDTTDGSVRKVKTGSDTTCLAYSRDGTRLAVVDRTKGPVVHDAPGGGASRRP